MRTIGNIPSTQSAVKATQEEAIPTSGSVCRQRPCLPSYPSRQTSVTVYVPDVYLMKLGKKRVQSDPEWLTLPEIVNRRTLDYAEEEI
jgi:hypothetical protein